MPANNPLDKVTFGHLTEACPKMTRRLRAGAGVEIAVWLTMWADRWQRQEAALPPPIDGPTGTYLAGMRRYLTAQIRAAHMLAAVTPDKFGAIEWDVACERVAKAMSDQDAQTTAAPTAAEEDANGDGQ